MRRPRSAQRRLMPRIVSLVLIAIVAGRLPEELTDRSVHAKSETWRQEGAPAFARAHREGVVLSDNGRLRLGHAVEPLGKLNVARVWDLARSSEGALLAATGDAGQVHRLGTKPGDAWTLLLDSNDSQILALVAGPGITAFAGTGPNGLFLDLNAPKRPPEKLGPGVRYIWDLAADSKGTIYAATGPEGQLWKRKSGKWSILYDSKATHLLSVAIGPDGSVHAGSDGEGLIYRIGQDGKTAVLFDAPQSDIRSLVVAPDGTLYAGTAAEAGNTSGNRNALFLSFSRQTPHDDGDRLPTDAGSALLNAIPAAQVPAKKPSDASKPSTSGSASPRPISPGDNAVYRIDADGIPREVLRIKALIHAMAWADNRLWIGTGPEGQLYEIRNQGEESAPVAKLESGQILALLPGPDKGLVIGTGDNGGVYRLGAPHVSLGRIVSEVHDTRLLSRFGALSWRAEKPEGTSVTFQCRSGNVGEPDETWSEWSAEQSDPDAARVIAPPGRFVQYRVKLATSDPGRTPELRSVALSYRTTNLAPELTRIEVPDLSAADGTARQTRLNLRWDVTDPNEDEMNFTVLVCKDGWPDWVRLNAEPVTERNLTWETTAFPSGTYRVKVIASDRPSNRPEDAFTRERESPSFLVDHDAPRIVITTTPQGARIDLADDLTRITRAEYAIDGGPWTPMFPDDRIFDSPRERIDLSLSHPGSGTHVLLVKATDAAGNVGTEDQLRVDHH